MGGSGKWIKSLMGLKKSEMDHNHQEKLSDPNKGKKWKLWRSSSGSRSGGRQSEATSETSSVAATGDPLSAAVGALVRAPPKDFEAIRQEWAAVRIQSAFRSFLARRALKALKGIVRIQALVRGRRVRKKFAITLKCMQALVRIQDKVRAQRLAVSGELPPLESNISNPIKLAEDGWCDKQGSVDEIKAKIQMRQEGAIKRERALSYAISSQKQWKAVTPNRKSSSLKSQEIDFTKPDSFQIRKNNISTRISLKPPSRAQSGSFSYFDESSPSNSSPVRFNFMSLTESTKARMSASRRKALSENNNGSHISVTCEKSSEFGIRRCDNKENCRFEGRLSPFP